MSPHVRGCGKKVFFFFKFVLQHCKLSLGESWCEYTRGIEIHLFCNICSMLFKELTDLRDTLSFIHLWPSCITPALTKCMLAFSVISVFFCLWPLSYIDGFPLNWMVTDCCNTRVATEVYHEVIVSAKYQVSCFDQSRRRTEEEHFMFLHLADAFIQSDLQVGR